MGNYRIKPVISGVYEIFSIATEEIYVGSSGHIIARWNEHFWQLENGFHPNLRLQNSWKKYGSGNFSFIILEECATNELVEREQSFLPPEKTEEALREQGFYNLNPIAYSVRGRKASDEERAKMRESWAKRENKKRSPEAVEKCRQKLLGRKRSEEDKAAMREGWAKRKGIPPKPIDPEIYRQNGIKARGRKMSEETKEKLRKANLGKKATEEAKRKMSESQFKRNEKLRAKKEGKLC